VEHDKEGKNLIFRDLATGKKRWEFPSKGPVYDYPCSVFLPDGSGLFATAEKAGVRVQDIDTGREVIKIFGEMPADGDFRFSPDGSTLILANKVGTQLWDLASGQVRLTLPETKVASTFFSPDGLTLISFTADNRVVLRESRMGQVLAADQCVAGFYAFSANGKILAITGPSSIALWDLSGGKLLARYPRMGQLYAQDDISALSSDGAILAVSRYRERPITLPSWIPDPMRGWLIESWNRSSLSLDLLDTSTGESLGSLPGVFQARFLPDGHTLMTIPWDRRHLYLWDVPPRCLLPWATPWFVLLIAIVCSGAWRRARQRKAMQIPAAGDSQPVA